MATREGEQLNWAKAISKRLHELVVAAKRSPMEPCPGVQFLSKLVIDQLGPAQVARTKLVKSEVGSSGTLVPVTQHDLVAERLIDLANVLKKPDESAKQVEALQQSVADLKIQLGQYQEQVEKQAWALSEGRKHLAHVERLHSLEVAEWESKVIQDRQHITNLGDQLRKAEEKVTFDLQQVQDFQVVEQKNTGK